MIFFTPKYQRQARLVLEILRKKRKIHADLLTEKACATLAQIEEMAQSWLQAKQEPSDFATQFAEAERLMSQVFPLDPWESWRENVDIFVVAIVLALAIRAYVLQPFKIPTNSMYPSLYGVVVTPTEEPMPSIAQRVLDFVVFGTLHHEVRVSRGGTLRFPPNPTQTFSFLFLTHHQTRFMIGDESFEMPVSADELIQGLGLNRRLIRQAQSRGEPLTIPPGVYRFKIEVGDQIFVDKVSVHFRPPDRGEVFIFTTTGIPGIERSLALRGVPHGQYYVKRNVARTGDSIRIEPPVLLVNERPADGSQAVRRNNAAMAPYRGYQSMGSFVENGQTVHLTPETFYYLQSKELFWAMGDNSFNSEDSRYWGAVPGRNVVGTGFMVYWPFSNRWGIIR